MDFTLRSVDFFTELQLRGAEAQNSNQPENCAVSCCIFIRRVSPSLYVLCVCVCECVGSVGFHYSIGDKASCIVRPIHLLLWTAMAALCVAGFALLETLIITCFNRVAYHLKHTHTCTPPTLVHRPILLGPRSPSWRPCPSRPHSLPCHSGRILYLSTPHRPPPLL